MAAELPFVGRVAESACLRSAFDDAARGEPRVVVVVGDLGVGKTRLVTEALRATRPVLFAGACVPVVAEPLPYAPIVQALRRLASKPLGRTQIEAFPELARLIAGVTPADSSGGLSAATGPQWRLYQAVLGLLHALGRSHPVALVVDDLHWADPATLDLLAHLAVGLTGERVCIVVTARSDHGRAGDPAHRAVAELGRLRHTAIVGLGALAGPDAVRLAALAGPALDPEQAHTLAHRAGGNPLLTEQLAQSGPGEASIPPTVEALLGARITALPHGARRLVQALAVLGGTGEIDALTAILDRPVAKVERAARAAVDGHVLVAVGPGLSFRHAASAEVAYADALPSERRRFHERAVRLLVGRTDDASVLALARHTEIAGVESVALALAAAGVADRRWAFGAAARLYDRAEALASATSAPAELRSIRIDAARAHSLAGQVDAAVAALSRALTESADARDRADILWRLGAVHFVAGHGEAAESVLAQARSLVELDEGMVAAAVFTWSARAAAAWSRVEQARSFGGRALALTQGAGPARLEGIAHNALGVAAALDGDLGAASKHLRTALTRAQESGSVDDLVAAYVNLGNVLGMSGDPAGQLAVCEQGIEHLGRCGVLRHSGSVLIANAVEALLLLGRLQEAYARGAYGMAIAPDGLVKAPVAMRAAQAAACVGRADQALAWSAVADELAAGPDAPATWRLAVAEAVSEVALWTGDPERAATTTAVGLDGARTAGLPRPGPLITLAWRSLADAREGGAPGSETRAALWRSVEAWGPAGDALEAAERGRAGGSAGSEGWERALASARGPITQAYVRWRGAEALLRGGGAGGAAVTAVRAAHAHASGLGLVPLVADIERAARWYRVELDPGAAAPEVLPTMLGLTAREREVLADVAAGCTNGEIATRHGISVKTASVHVSNILRKLGVPTRQDAARVAHRHGLTGG